MEQGLLLPRGEFLFNFIGSWEEVRGRNKELKFHIFACMLCVCLRFLRLNGILMGVGGNSAARTT